MLDKFSTLDEVKKFKWNIKDILPKILVAGENAGTLTEKELRFLTRQVH